jgi:hypothetical protein
MKLMANHSSARAHEETPHASQTTTHISSDEDSSISNVEALTEIICGAGEKASAALLVLMSMLQNSTEPTVLAHTAKHLAFTRCGELNVNGMVDAQAVVFKGELLASHIPD